MEFTKKQIFDFAQSNDIGMDILINKRTLEITETPSTSRNPHFEVFEEDLEKLESMWHEVVKIECPYASESFEIMAIFTENLKESYLKEKLTNALNNRKPFRNFNHIVHNSSYREDWFKHKQTKLEERVTNIILKF